MVQIYAPYLYGSGYIVCGHQYTNRKGKASFTVGEAKQYLSECISPQFGWSPKDSTQAYYLIQGQAAAGATYNVIVPYANVKPWETLQVRLPCATRVPICSFLSELDGNHFGCNVHDAQNEQDSTSELRRGRHRVVPSSATGANSRSCFNAEGSPVRYSPYVNGGNFYHYLPDNEKRYAVFLNTSSANILEKVAASCEIRDGTITSMEWTPAPSRITETYPSPVREVLLLQVR